MSEDPSRNFSEKGVSVILLVAIGKEADFAHDPMRIARSREISVFKTA
jgi:hypothetical protein